MQAIPVFLIFVMLVPASMFLASPIQAQDEPSVLVSTGLSGLKDVPLKAIQSPNGDIDINEDFEIVPDSLITVGKGEDFHVLPDEGSLTAVKATDEKKETIDLIFFSADGRVRQDLESKAYLLDVILTMENDDKFLYETILAVLEPGQSLNAINTQNIIQNFVTSTSETHTTVVFKDNDDDDNEPPEEEPSICYFEPNDAPECEPDEDGNCPNDWPMNEDGNCHPGGQCPDGFERVDDDETGTCYSKEDTFHCPGSNAIVLDEEDCAIYEPDEPVDPRQVCYFEPNDEVCNPDENGECLEGMGFNDDGQCIPQGDCPDGYARLDDDETGRCYAEAATKICQPSNIRVLQSQPCPEASDVETEDVVNDTEDAEEVEEPETDPIICEEGFVLENGKCAALDSNCGGVPCTASDKEDSWTSDVPESSPGVPITDSEIQDEPKPLLSADIVPEDDDSKNDNGNSDSDDKDDKIQEEIK